MALAQSVVEAIKALLGNKDEQHAFEQDEHGWLAARGLSDLSGQDVYTAMEHLVAEELNPNLAMLYTPYTGSSAAAAASAAAGGSSAAAAAAGASTFTLGGGIGTITVPPPPPPTRSGIPQLEHVLEVRNEYVSHITHINDADTTTVTETTNLTDQRVTQGDIFALGDVSQDFNQRSATATEGATAVTGDVSDSTLTSVGGDMTGNQIARDAGQMANVGRDNSGFSSAGDTSDTSVNTGSMGGGTQIAGVRDNAGETAFGTGEGSVATGLGQAATGTTETSLAGRDVLEEGSIGGDLVAPGGDALSSGGNATNTDALTLGSGATAVGDLPLATGENDQSIDLTVQPEPLADMASAPAEPQLDG